ncbi:MAG: glycosyltransferase, partial [Microbacteriaceae bacterium]|nr:glycosyltransferase [Microbacteriaceae bacterium]
MSFPDAEYLVLSSRLVPGLDGGFTIATMQRARHMAAAGVDAGRGPWLLTVDPGSRAEHDAHRAEFGRLGLLDDPARLRNLFDEAGAG